MKKGTKLSINFMNDKSYFKLDTYANNEEFSKVNVLSSVFSTSVEYKDFTKVPYGMVGYVKMEKLDFFRLQKLRERNCGAVRLRVNY